MCVCCCTNECAKWFLECLASPSPTSSYSEELLYGDQTFESNEGADASNESSVERLERLRRKREHRLRSTSLLKASQMIDENNDMVDQFSSHQRKQLFNGHGYNLAIYKGQIRGNCCR